MSSKLNQLTNDEESVTVDSSPMIDMVFQLILFFMVSSRLLVNQIDPRVDLPVWIRKYCFAATSERS